MKIPCLFNKEINRPYRIYFYSLLLNDWAETALWYDTADEALEVTRKEKRLKVYYEGTGKKRYEVVG